MFVFSLVLVLGVVLFWAFRRLWSGAMSSFDPHAHAHRPSAVAAGAGQPIGLATVQPRAATPSSVTPSPSAAPTSPASAYGASSAAATPTVAEAPAPVAQPDADSAPGAESSPIVGPAAVGAPDNLRRLIGIGPANERHLNGLGISTFAQIAAWTTEDIHRVEAVLAFDGRIARERWVEQAGLLARGETDEFLRRFPQAGNSGNT